MIAVHAKKKTSQIHKKAKFTVLHAVDSSFLKNTFFKTKICKLFILACVTRNCHIKVCIFMVLHFEFFVLQ